MLYPFALSPGAVSQIGYLAPPHHRDRVAALRKLWRESGYMVLDRDARLQRVLEDRWKQAGFPQSTRKLLQDLFIEMKQRIIRDRYWVSAEPDGKEVPAGPEGGTHIVSTEEAAQYGCSLEEFGKVCPRDVEICRLDCLASSRWNELRTARILPKKAETQGFLRSLSPLLAIASKAEIIDPYCGKEEVVKPGCSGLLRFLTQLGKGEGRYEQRLRALIIYTAKNVPRSTKDPSRVDTAAIVLAWSSAMPILAKAGIQSVVLHLVDGVRFPDIAHDRFGSFGEGDSAWTGDIAFQVGAGFAAFEGKRLSKETTFGVFPTADFRSVVKELEAEASAERHELGNAT